MLEKVVAEIDAEIARLNQVKVLLMASEGPVKRGPGRPAKAATATPRKAKRRRMSAEARERIRQAQIQRWAAQKKSGKAPAK